MPESQRNTRCALENEELVEALCDEIACGNGVKEASEIVGVHYSSVFKKMARDQAFATRIARAREAQQDAESEHIVDMADAATVKNWNVVKLRIWARQWRAARLAPKKYGDRISTENTTVVKVEHTRKLDISTLSDDQLDALEGALRATVAQLQGPVVDHEE